MFALVLYVAFLACPGVLRADDGKRETTLSAGDRIAVTVLGQSDISSEVLVDGAGSIGMFPIGRVDVAGLTLGECEEKITRRLSDGFLRNPVVSVRIVEARPIYVVGDVRSPGAFPFRYGSTVVSAIASAGGVGPPDPVMAEAASQYLTADARVRQLESEQAVFLVRQARLEAQRALKDNFASPNLPPTAGDQALPKIVSAEQDVLTSQLAALRQQLDLLHQQKPRLELEIESINKQMAVEKDRLAVLTQELALSNQNLKQGIGLRSVEVNLKLEQATEEGRLWEFVGQISRLRMNLGELDLKALQLKSAFQMQALTELQNVRDRLAELRVSLPAERQLREMRRQLASRAIGFGSGRTTNIIRMKGGSAAVLEANELTLLQPGDVVNVRFAFPTSSRCANGKSLTAPGSEGTSGSPCMAPAANLLGYPP